MSRVLLTIYDNDDDDDDDGVIDDLYKLMLLKIIFFKGTAWETVAPPDLPQELGPCRLLQVSAGLNSVWALTKDGQVIQATVPLLVKSSSSTEYIP